MRSYAISFEILSGIYKGVRRWNKSQWRLTGLRVSSKSSSEQQNVWLGLVKFIMDPSSGLLDTQTSPFLI
jgi:hypothetical protein